MQISVVVTSSPIVKMESETVETEDNSRLTDELKNVIEKSELLADELQSLQSTNSSLKFYTNKLLVKLREFSDHFSDEKPTNKCSVCYMRRRSHAIVPCGHFFCEACVTRCQTRNQCFVCRGEPSGVLKVFG